MEQQWLDSLDDMIRFRGKNSDAVRGFIKLDGDLVYLSPDSKDGLNISFYLDQD